MQKVLPVVVEAAIAGVITVGMSLAANLVTDGRSLWWALVLVALLSCAVAVDTVERLRKRRAEDPDVPIIPRSRSAATGKHIALGIALLTLLGSFALVVGRLVSTDASCRVEELRNYRELPYNCDIAWSRTDPAERRVPLYRWPKPGPVALDVLDADHSGSDQFFACQIESPDVSDGYGFSGGSRYWALAPGDDADLWGWMPQVFLEHGANGDREPNLPECSEEQKAKAGTTFVA
ncbi:hypothetical protein AB0C07_29580 [Actinoplanes missouriensis]|uniref:hypothetical protein n=1 Tax=Actinoplanes missouriensis TaxID=1866 RepID=UPI0033F2A997